MKLRQRNILILSIALVTLVLSVHFLAPPIILRSYSRIEREDMERNLQRTVDALDRRYETLNESAQDWSQWDECYEFMADGNRRFRESTLGFIALNIDIMLLVDANGKTYAEGDIPSFDGLEKPNAEVVRRSLGFDDAAFVADHKGKTFNTAITLGDTVMLAAVRPILNSRGDKPARGWIVFGQYLSPIEMDALKTQLHLNLTAHVIENHPLDPELSSALIKLQANPNYTRVLDENRIAGYTLVRDRIGRPIVLLKVIEPRTVYAQGVQTVNLLVLYLIGAAVTLCLVVFFVVERFVLSRLARLTNEVDEIGEGRRLHTSLSGHDELARLGTRVNEMVGNLEEARLQLRQKHEALKQTVGELREKNNLLENALEGIAEVSPTGELISANPAFAKSLYLTPEEAIGMSFRSFVAPDDQGRFLTEFTIVESLGKSECEMRFIRPGKGIAYHHCVIVGSFAPDGSLSSAHIFTKDISERKRLESQIEHQAFHDPLTGLPNRALFLNRLATAQSRARRNGTTMALFFLDLDDFKKINDTLGHQTGDQLLTGFAERLHSCLRPHDTLSRLAGDEFTIIVEDLQSESEVGIIASRIQQSLVDPILVSEGEIFASASIGIALSVRGSITADRLLRNADTAMYQAKSAGKGCHVVFDDVMDEAAHERVLIESELRHALDRQELYLDYQPIVSISSGEIVGFEALIRWRHPVRGIISPGLFISIAEETGLISRIGEWVLHEATQQAARWNARLERPIEMNVNLSVQQIQHGELAEVLGAALASSGLSPEHLRLEISESVATAASRASRKVLSQIGELGVRIAIDDLGTARLPKGKLAELNADVVKIDRSFVSKLGSDATADGIVQATVGLARSQNIHVTAEGVQTPEQLSKLAELGCDFAQGYLFFTPMSPTDIEAKLFGNGVDAAA